MINNRQQSGRRRGRGGQRPQNGQGGRPEQGNRIDNRARGNAAQLLEKYKSLARDAQTQGDRVMTEYYLQFADHYFRVLSETRSRFEENQPRRPQGDTQDFEDEGEDYRGDEGGYGDESQQQPEAEQLQREDRSRNRDRDRQPRRDQGDGYAPQTRNDQPRNDNRSEQRPEARDGQRDEPRGEQRPERRPRTERPRRNGAAEANGNIAEGADEIGIADRLPPALSIPVTADEEAPPPRRRPGRPRKVETSEAPVEG